MERIHEIQQTILEILAGDCHRKDELLRSLAEWYDYSVKEAAQALEGLISTGRVEHEDGFLGLAEQVEVEAMRPAA